MLIDPKVIIKKSYGDYLTHTQAIGAGLLPFEPVPKSPLMALEGGGLEELATHAVQLSQRDDRLQQQKIVLEKSIAIPNLAVEPEQIYTGDTFMNHDSIQPETSLFVNRVGESQEDTTPQPRYLTPPCSNMGSSHSSPVQQLSAPPDSYASERQASKRISQPGMSYKGLPSTVIRSESPSMSTRRSGQSTVPGQWMDDNSDFSAWPGVKKPTPFSMKSEVEDRPTRTSNFGTIPRYSAQPPKMPASISQSNKRTFPTDRSGGIIKRQCV